MFSAIFFNISKVAGLVRMPGFWPIWLTRLIKVSVSAWILPFSPVILQVTS